MSPIVHQPFIQGFLLNVGLIQRLGQQCARFGQVLTVGRPVEKVVDRLAERAVPVLIEAVTQLLGHRPHTEHVDVGEIQIGLRVEILVAQIASADDGHGAIGQPQLVMHASMLLGQIEQPAQITGGAHAAAQIERIEQADLNVRVRSECGDDFIQPVAGGVVQQNAHANAAIGGFEQFVNQCPRAQAVVNDVVLQVQAGFGVANQLGAGHEGFGAVGQQAEARAPLVRCGLGHDRAAERGLRCRQRLTRSVRSGRVRTTAEA